MILIARLRTLKISKHIYEQGKFKGGLNPFFLHTPSFSLLSSSIPSLSFHKSPLISSPFIYEAPRIGGAQAPCSCVFFDPSLVTKKECGSAPASPAVTITLVLVSPAETTVNDVNFSRSFANRIQQAGALYRSS